MGWFSDRLKLKFFAYFFQLNNVFGWNFQLRLSLIVDIIHLEEYIEEL